MADPKTVPYSSGGLRVAGLAVDVVQGPDAGRSARAVTDTLTIGSAPGNDLVLQDPTVSRYHVELSRLDDGISIVDLGALNGTFVGAVRVERGLVPPGTVLRLGRTQVRLGDGDAVPVDLLGEDRFGELVGGSPLMQKLMAQIRRASTSDASVLVSGETGSGKELIARAIHDASPRARGPFETVDCGALMPTLVASELFGHEKGAFTGADRQHVGAFERADGGTIFLDEIGELPPSLQPALLGVLERRSFRRIGAQKPIEVDVRIVAATHRDLRAEVNAGSFRQDLYFRLAVVPLRVPPLRERASDIPLLVEHFLREAGHSGPVSEIVPDAVLDSLRAHRWPGNVRELRNFVESALALGEPLPLDGATSAGDERGSGFPSVPLATLNREPYQKARAQVIAEFEAQYLEELLARNGGNVSRAARESGIARTYLTAMLKRQRLRDGDGGGS
ncbi:sigma 54-interacting transcriptional regulator [Myxococcota bacterium]|nr:sigma 54-interacting transcriptional regulator [Myxococcota bacterium]